MYCSISGTAPREPVLSKTGYIFERRLLEEHIHHAGTCPVSNEPLTENDLTDIKVNRVVKPRTVATTSIPAMLQTFQNEWDALMVETYELRKQLDQSRTQLATALYKQDAAERTIARLVKERDQAMQQASSGAPRIADAPARQADAGELAPMELEGGGLSEAQAEQLQSTADKLIEQRKARTVSASVAESSEVQGLRETGSKAVGRKGLSAVALSEDGGVVAVGGSDGHLEVRSSDGKGKALATLKGHSKAITALAFARLPGTTGEALVSASADCSVRIWTAAKGYKYKEAHVLDSLHQEEVTGVAVHASGQFGACVSRDQSWTFLDLAAGAPVYNVAPAEVGAFSAVAFHPDGLLLATGTEDASHLLRLWDVKSKENVISFPGHSKPIHSISFSENGVHLATGAADASVKLWDLRNLAEPVFFSETGAAPVNSVSFDLSGQYLAVGGQDIQIYSVSGDNAVNHLTRLAGHTGSVTGLKWGADAKTLYSVSTDKNLKTFTV